MKLSDLPSQKPKGTIVFFLYDTEVGRTGLPVGTDMESRHELAKLAKVEKYNNFHMLGEDGKLKVNANEIPKVIQNHISPCEWQGEHEGYMYKYFNSNL
jgi:hypothetical protein